MSASPNPYRPGAGVSPPVLAGREAVLTRFDALAREVGETGEGRRPWVLVGTRGVGKTVLLAELRDRAADAGWLTARVEAGPPETIAASLVRELFVPLRRAVADQRGRARTSRSLPEGLRRVLAVFSAFKLQVDTTGRLTFGIDVDVPREAALTGDLGTDVYELLRALGLWVRSEGRCALLTIDELDAAPPADLAGLNKALHLLGQDELPVPLQVVGAGQPQLPALLVRANPYAERLYEFLAIAALPPRAAGEALTAPARHLGVTWEEDGLVHAVAETWGVPYFLQSVGRIAWDLHSGDQITAPDARGAVALAFTEAQGLFRARWDQATPAQQSVIAALAALGGDADVAAVAEKMGRTTGSLSRVRADLVARGFVEAPRSGRVRFTLPGFAEFVVQGPGLDGGA